MRFLPRGHRIAVEDVCPEQPVLGEFEIPGAFELTSVIRQNDRKQSCESFKTKAPFEVVEHSFYRLCFAVRQKKQKHNGVISENHRQESLAALPDTLYGIHLNNPQTGMLHTGFEVFVCASLPISFICKALGNAFVILSAPPVSGFAAKINVPYGEFACIDVVIQAS